MVRRKIKAIFLPLFLFFLLFVACLVLANELIQRPGVQQYFLKELSKSVGYDLRATDIELTLWRGIGISARNLDIRSPEGKPVLSSARIRIHLKGRALLQGRIVPTQLVLVEPVFELAMGSGKVAPAKDDGPDGKILGALAAFSSLGLENARLKLKGLPFDLGGLDMNLSRTSRDPLEIAFFSKGAVDYNKRTIPFSISGTATRKAGQSMSGDMIIKSDAIPLTAFPWPHDLPFHGGVAKIRLKVQGSPDSTLWVKGVMDTKDLDFSILDEGDKKRFSFNALSIPFQGSYAGKRLEIRWLKVQGRDFYLEGTSRIDFKTPSNPALSLRIGSPAMPLATFKRLFPSSLVPAWLEARLFPCFSGGTVRLDDFSLKGSLHELEDLDHYENAHALTLGLTCEGLTAFEGGSGLPMEGISGQIMVKNGMLGIKGVKGAFGSSQVKTGRLRVDTLYSDSPMYEASVSGDFDIRDLLTQRHLDFMKPAVDRLQKQNMDWLLEPGAVDGRLDAQVKVAYQQKWNDPKIISGKFELSSCRLNASELIFPAVVTAGTVELDEKGGGEFNAEGRWGQSAIRMSGSIGKSWKAGRADMTAKADLEGLLGRFYPSMSNKIHAENPVPIQLTVSKEPDRWSFHGTLRPKGVFMETEAVRVSPFEKMERLSFDGRFVPGKEVMLEKLTCFSRPTPASEKIAAPPLTLKGSYGLKGDKGIAVGVRADQLNLEDLGVVFKRRKLTAKGAISCDVRIHIPEFVERAKPDSTMPTVTGTVEGDQLSIESKDIKAPIKDVNFKIQCEKQTCSIDFLNMKMGQSACRVEGKLSGWKGLRGELSLSSNYVDISQLYAVGLPGLEALYKGSQPSPGAAQGGKASVGAPSHSGFIEQTNVRVNLYVKEGRWGEIGFGPLNAACAVQSGDLYVNSGELGLKYGRVRFKGHLKRGQTPGAELSAYVNLTRVPIKELPDKLENLKEYIEGDISTEGLLYVKGLNKKAWLSSLTGGANITIEKGVIRKSNTFIKILQFLSIRDLLTKDKSGISGKGLRFDKIEGSIDFDDGTAQLERMRLRGPVLNAVGRGKIDLLQDRVDGEVGVEPLGTIDMVISHLPIVGHLLTGEKKALYVDYFKVEGPLSDPDVRYIPFKSLSSGTIGFIKRLFMSPGTLYKNIADRKRDLDRKGLPVPDTLQPEKDMGM